MTDQPEKTTLEAVQGVAQVVADGVSATADRASSAMRQASDGVTGFRAVVRKQPITMAFVMLAMGYVLGSHLSHGRS